jgi:hypothetical protein
MKEWVQGHEITISLTFILTNIESLLKRDGVKNLLPQMKKEKVMYSNALCYSGSGHKNDNNKVNARNNLHSRLQFEEFFSHLPASVLL